MVVSQKAADWWRGAVIYQVYPRSFQDTTGDGIGDLKGVKERLPYIASLGVDAIWLSPFFKSPMADMGYDVSDYCDVDPMFGTLSDFDEMLGEAHERALAQVVGAALERQADHADAPLARSQHLGDRVIDVRAVGHEYARQHRQLDVSLAGEVSRRAEVLRQARAAEGEPGF